MNPIAAPAHCASCGEAFTSVHALAPRNAPVNPPNTATVQRSIGVAMHANSTPTAPATTTDLPISRLKMWPIVTPSMNASTITTHLCHL